MRRLSIIVPLMVLVLTACTGSIFDENFDTITDVPEILVPDDTVLGIVENDGLLRIINMEQGRNLSGYVLLDVETETDYSLEARVRINEGIGQFWVRADDDACSGYALVIDPTRNSYRLSTFDENCSLQTLDDVTKLDLGFDEWIDIRIEARGSRIRGFINGAPLFDIEDETYATGKPLIRLVNETPRTAQIELDTLRLR